MEIDSNTPRGQPDEKTQQPDEDAKAFKSASVEEIPLSALQEGERPAYIMVDMEGFGNNPLKYPTFAVAFVVMSNKGRRLFWSSHYLPYDINEAAFEPRCWKEFVSCKLDPAVYKGYVRACSETRYEQVPDAWIAIAKQLDWIYEKYDTDEANPLVWIADCDHYDMGRLNQYFAVYAGRQEAWYSHKRIHWIRNISEGKKVMKALNPAAYKTFEEAMKKSPYSKSHDPVDDASHIGYEYVAYKSVLDVYTYKTGEHTIRGFEFIGDSSLKAKLSHEKEQEQGLRDWQTLVDVTTNMPESEWAKRLNKLMNDAAAHMKDNP